MEKVTIFLNFFLKILIQFVYSNILKHFQTLLNIYFQGEEAVEVQPDRDKQATQTKEGGAKQLKNVQV